MSDGSGLGACEHRYRWAKTLSRPVYTTQATPFGAAWTGTYTVDVFYCERCLARQEQGTNDPVTVGAEG